MIEIPAFRRAVLCVTFITWSGFAATPLATTAEAQESRAQFFNTREGMPFSEAVRAGDFLFLSGQVGTSGETLKLVPGGIVPEARQTLTNIKNTLERHGSSLADVVKCTVFLADIAEWSEFNEVYREFFQAPYPARSALGASGLALSARAEVECIAYVPKRR